MARYNPNNKQHRKNLAKRIAKMLLSSGFSLEGSSRNEDVYQRAATGVTSGSAQIRVFTSALYGEMRTVGEDAIRVCAVYTDNAGQSRGLVKSTRINRTGDTDGITGRLLEAMRKTYKIAQKRANDPGFHALPVKPSKKRWVPRKKKAGSKPKTARRLNTAVKAAAQTQEETPPIPDFKVGDLVTGDALTSLSAWKGMVKAISGQTITVFWFHNGSTHGCRLPDDVAAEHLRPLAAAPPRLYRDFVLGDLA